MISMPSYTFKCEKCGKIFSNISTISKRNESVECDCGGIANRDVESELAPQEEQHKWITENERWSRSMGCPPSQVEEFRKRFPNSIYNDDGRLLVKNYKDKLRQMAERDMVEWGANEHPWRD
jgi:putative FmdB family regulatory protein